MYENINEPHIQVKGCHFHQKQAIRRNIQEEGLTVLINNSSKFEYLVKMMFGLAFVAPIRVGELFESVIMEYVTQQKDDDGFQDNEEQIDDFLSYFERTWAGALSGNRAGGRKAPRFALETWNKYEDVVEKRPITNNTCEGFNSGWTGTMNKRLSLFVVLEGFLNKKSWSHTVLLEDSMAVGGNRTDLNKSRALSSVQRRLDLQALVQDIDSMMSATFLDSIVKFFAND
jgi:hypothetical protein